ncbi:hypothetical protein [Dysgonomonas sp. 521]|nr:hypothetical protein [Dysgonomonas sp. 521]
MEKDSTALLTIVLQNDTPMQRTVTVQQGEKSFSYDVPASSVISCIWE